MKTILRCLLLLIVPATVQAQITNSSYTSEVITVPAGGYTLNYAVFWTCNDFPVTSAPGRVELINNLGQMVGWTEGHVTQYGATAQTDLGTATVISSAMFIMSPNLMVADGAFAGSWQIQGIPPGTYTLRFWDFETQPGWVPAATVWTHTFFQGGFAAPPPLQYPLTTSATSGGSVSPGGLFAANAMVSVSATPGPAYDFAGWAGDAAGATNPIGIVMDRAKSVQAVFAPKRFPLTTSAAPGGSVTPGGLFNAGTLVSVSATPDPAYDFTGWTGDAGSATNPIGIMMDRAKSVQAVFAPKQFSLTTGATTGGTVSPGGLFNAGTLVSVAATPDPAYDFTGWTGDAAGMANPIGIVMDRAKSVQAMFAPKMFSLTTGAMPGGSVSPGGSYPYGTLVAVTASADPNYRFTGWSGDASGTAATVTVTLNRPLTVLANFTGKLAQTISFPPPAYQSAGTSFTLAATATSGLPVAFTVVSGPATWSTGLLTITGAGAVTVAATQSGDATYLAAPPVIRTFNATTIATLRFQIAPRTLLQERSLSQPGNYVIHTSP
jgi:hypothetical protein